MLLEMLATLSAGLFAGAAIYINLVEHPARMECGTELAVGEFAPSYRRATVMQAALSAVGFLVSAAAWLTGSSMWWLVGALPWEQLSLSPSSLFSPPIKSCWIPPWIRAQSLPRISLSGGEDYTQRGVL